MAYEGVTLPGTGEIVAVDTVGGKQIQAVKLDGGGDGASQPITGTTAEGLDVDVTRVSGVVHVDDNGATLSVDDGAGSLTVDGTVAVSAIGGVVDVSGSLVDVTGSAVTAVVSGTVAVSGVAAVVHVDDNAGSLTVDGTVAVSSVVPGVAATSLGKAEDAAAVSGDTGVMALAVRRDVPGTGIGADGDYVPLAVDVTNRLLCDVTGQVSIGGVVTVSGVTPGVAATNLGKAEDAAHSSGDTGVMALAVRRDTPSTGVGADGDYVALGVDSNGRLHVDITGLLTSVVPGVAATSLGKAEDAAHVSGDTGVAMWGVRRDSVISGAGTDGDYASLNLDANGRLYVNNAGDTAHDAVDAGNPIKFGGVARTTNPTAVADADRVNASFDRLGRLLVALDGPRELLIENTITLSSTTETSLLAAIASTFQDLTIIWMTNTSSTPVRVDIRDVTGGAVRFSFFLAASGGGAAPPIFRPLKQTTVNTAWTAQLSTAITDVRIFAQAVKSI